MKITNEMRAKDWVRLRERERELQLGYQAAAHKLPPCKHGVHIVAALNYNLEERLEDEHPVGQFLSCQECNPDKLIRFFKKNN